MAAGRSAYVEEDTLLGLVEEWLSTPVPEQYLSWCVDERVSWRRDEAMGIHDLKGTTLLDEVCVVQLWEEMLDRKPGALSRVDSLDLGRALRELGWAPHEKVKKFRYYGPQRAFARPANGGLL